MNQTIKPGNYNYYLMSNDNFINVDDPQILEDITDNLIIQIINVSRNVKKPVAVHDKIISAKSLSAQTQKLRKQALTSENANILKNKIIIRDNISVEFS
jgi:hypothetical protein